MPETAGITLALVAMPTLCHNHVPTSPVVDVEGSTTNVVVGNTTVDTFTMSIQLTMMIHSLFLHLHNNLRAHLRLLLVVQRALTAVLNHNHL